MKINSLSVNNLFGTFNYTINFDNEVGLSLITGPNGYGKTTLLRIISCLNTKKLYYFYDLKFDKISIILEDQNRIQITKIYETNLLSNAEDTANRSTALVKFEWITGNHAIASFSYNMRDISKAISILKYSDSFSSIISEDLSKKSSFFFSNEKFNQQIAKLQNNEQFLLLLGTLNTYYLSANRIYIDNENDDKNSPVETISYLLKDKLRIAQFDFLNRSQVEDSQFINEILSDSSSQLSETDYYHQTSRIKNDLVLLQKYGMTNNIVLPNYSIPKQSIIGAYIKHLNNKVTDTKNILSKIELFDQMLREKSFINKSISFSPRYGIRVQSIDKDFLDLNYLSSGEQNEIIMLYKLIFEVQNKSTLLIDEPENSLHVSWQKAIIKDLLKLAEIKEIQIIIATHSPTIVSQGLNYTTDLYYIK